MPTRSQRLGAAAILAVLAIAGAAFVSLPAIVRRVALPRERLKELRAAIEGARYVGDSGVILQKHRNDCAAACLKMILAGRGIERDLSTLALDAGTSAAGASIAGLRVAAARAGIESRAWFLTKADLRRAPLPAIAFVRSDHFVVIRRFLAPDLVEVDDPAIGRLHWRFSAFARAWKGETIVFDPTWDPQQRVSCR